MATSTRLSLLEYLKTGYRPDCEYVAGELLERNVGNWEHARVQALLAGWFQSQEKAGRSFLDRRRNASGPRDGDPRKPVAAIADPDED